MKAAVASVLGCAAAVVSAQYTNQSAPFALIVVSSNASIDAHYLGSCHEGAGIEGICLGTPVVDGDVGYSEFTFNTSSTPQSFDPSIGEPGYLVFELEGGNFNESQSAELSFSAISNVAIPMFAPIEGGTVFSFDNEGLLNIPAYVDDSQDPPNLAAEKAYYRWYICETYFGYAYETLSWVLGDQPPQNPSCQPCNVTRTFY